MNCRKLRRADIEQPHRQYRTQKEDIEEFEQRKYRHLQKRNLNNLAPEEWCCHNKTDDVVPPHNHHLAIALQLAFYQHRICRNSHHRTENKGVSKGLISRTEQISTPIRE